METYLIPVVNLERLEKKVRRIQNLGAEITFEVGEPRKMVAHWTQRCARALQSL